MSTPIPFLSALVVLSSAFPAQAVQVGAVPARVRQFLVPAVFSVVAVLAWYVAPASGVLARPSSLLWLAVGAGTGCAAPVFEIGLGALMARGRRVRVGLHDKATSLGLLAVVVTGMAEEVVFRGVGLHLLETVLHWPALVAIAVTAIVYGFNHLWFGGLTVLQKTGTGLLFGALYDLSGHSLVVPLLAHVVQNLVVLLVLPRWLSR
jgi:membrane protease YdiL (CAAX protease family)